MQWGKINPNFNKNSNKRLYLIGERGDSELEKKDSLMLWTRFVIIGKEKGMLSVHKKINKNIE